MPVLAEGATVTEVDVIAVDDAGMANLSSLTKVPGPVIGTWTGPQVGEILDLMAALPSSVQMRCFNPVYGLRLRGGSQTVAETAVCFECHWAVAIHHSGDSCTQSDFTFDPDSAPAQELLRRFRSIRSRRI